MGIQLAKGILADRNAFFGMQVDKALEIPYPKFYDRQIFRVDGAVVARKQREDRTKEYLFFDNPEADVVLTRVLRKKMVIADFPDFDVESTTVKFNRETGKGRTKKMTIKNIEHKGSSCQVVVEGTPESSRFAWLVGVGELTGSGFGALE